GIGSGWCCSTAKYWLLMGQRLGTAAEIFRGMGGPFWQQERGTDALVAPVLRPLFYNSSYSITYILIIQDRSRARRDLKELVDRCHQCISAVDLARQGAADLPLRV